MKAYWVIGFMMAAGLRAQPQDCSVNVYLMTGVLVPAGMLGNATLKAAAMFREIGVDLRMRDGLPARDPGDNCGAPIVVEFENATGYQNHAGALAYALPYKESGTSIHVFLDRVVRQNPDPGFANAVLAHVMVHEITHVLERISRHSEEGVMKAHWSIQDYRRMEHGPLPFAPVDVQLIHRSLARRITHVAVK